MLTDALPPHGLVVISLSDTRWSARADATRSAFAHYRVVLKVATDICADGLAKQTERLETALMTVVWHTILERFNATSLSLQKVYIDLISAVKLYDSLVTFLLQLRDRFDNSREG